MDIFKFTSSDPTILSQGKIANGIKSKLWVERYRDISTFELICDIDKMVHKLLTVGSLISHRNTYEVMVVENHEITDNKGSETEIKITGRSFESILENRVVGSNKAWPTVASANAQYSLTSDHTWNQIVRLIKGHIDATYLIDPNDIIPNVDVLTNIFGAGTSEERVIPSGELYTRVIELMDIDNLGIKTIRPNPNSPLGYLSEKLAILIHKGTDKSNFVVFSNISGEIESADYLWSNKNFKNCALIKSRWFETVIKDSSEGYSRRMMLVDAADIDNEFSEAPTGATRTLILALMQARGKQAIAAQKPTVLVNTEITKNANAHRYRRHYDLGDIIMVSGNYSETAKMRVTEFVEIEDENGETGYPTLSAV